jgi:hypothetical protein
VFYIAWASLRNSNLHELEALVNFEMKARPCERKLWLFGQLQLTCILPHTLISNQRASNNDTLSTMFGWTLHTVLLVKRDSYLSCKFTLRTDTYCHQGISVWVRKLSGLTANIINEKRVCRSELLVAGIHAGVRSRVCQRECQTIERSKCRSNHRFQISIILDAPCFCLRFGCR